MPEAMAGAMPSAVGIRMQYIPEFEHRYGRADLSALTDEQIANLAKEKFAALGDIANNSCQIFRTFLLPARSGTRLRSLSLMNMRI